MGKEWYWGGRSSKRGGEAETEIPSGCMCAVFKAFDFHPFHFSMNHQQSSFKSRTPEVPKGAEAPRNSLESKDGTTVSSISKEESFKIPKNIRIKTSGSTRSRAGSFSGDLSSEISASPGTKTPTLVARLMGLDLLPDAHSSSSTPNLQTHYRPRQHIKIIKHRNSTGSSDNLPETPRMSSARRSDVEHRLSLQINKENTVPNCEDFETPRFSFSKRKYYDESNNSSRSPSHYARQIVKQVKESVSRKVGFDITNTVKNREQGKEEFVSQFKFKKLSKNSLNESSPGKHSNPSQSPRLSRFIDTKNKPTSPITPKNNQRTNSVLKPSSPPPVVNIETQLSRVSTKPKPQALTEKELQNQKSVTKCKKTNSGKLSSRVNKPPQTSIRNKQEESFIIRAPSATKVNENKTKNKRSHPLSSNLLNNLNTVPNLLPVKTGLSTQKQSQIQVFDAKRSTQLFSCSRQTHTQTHRTRGGGGGGAGGATTIDHDKSHGAITSAASDQEYHYIATILTRTTNGSHHNYPRMTIIPLLHQFQWFSPTHPLDPSVFHRLEHYPTSDSFVSFPDNKKDCTFEKKHHLGPRCNRRLLFDLVDELLSEILSRPNKRYGGGAGWLLETVWERVQSFPRAKCEVLEDIDALIEIEEMREEEEEQGLVAEIEKGMLETLLHETFTVMVGGVVDT